MKKLVPLFIFLFMLTNGYTQIKKWNNVTKLTNETSANYFKLNRTISNKKFRIANNFFINTDIRFSNCIFYMDSFSSIIVMNNCKVTFDSCILLACDTIMWKGFTILPTATLNLNDSKIYDADTAIVCRKNGVFHINSATMNRNLVGISVYPNLVSANTSSIYHSQIYCHNDSVPIFTGVSPPTDGTLLYPYRKQKTHFGIYVRDNIVLNVGDTITGLDLRNKFEDMYDGIYSRNSGLQVRNCDFYKMRTLVDYYYDTTIFTYVPRFTRANAIEFYNDSTLITPTTGLHVIHCTMDSVYNACVYLEGSMVFDTIEYNNMSGYYGVLANNMGFNLQRNRYSYTKIQYNTIKYSGSIRAVETLAYPTSIGNPSYCGINLNANKKVIIEINDNYIIPRAFYPIHSESGIYIKQATLNSTISPSFRIVDNKIVNGKFGIRLYGALVPVDYIAGIPHKRNNNLIYNNLLKSNDTKSGYYGMYIQNSNDINILQNTIKGSTTDANNSKQKRGISLHTSKNNRIACNIIDTLHYGFRFAGDCSMKNKLFGNEFNNIRFHIYGDAGAKLDSQLVVDDGTALGLTLFHANKMFAIADGNSIKNLGVTFYYASRFAPPMYDPLLRSIAIPPTVGVLFLNASGSEYQCALIDTLLRNSIEEDANNDAQNLLKIANSTDTITAEENIGSKMMNEEYIFNQIQNDPNLIVVNTELNDYYETKSAEHVGTMSEIKQELANENYEAASVDIANIYISNYQQEADKIVYEILNKYEQRDEATLLQSELQTLFIYANYCPIRYGSAVYTARVLINSQKGYEAYSWDDDEICIKGVSYRRANQEDETSNLVENKNITIYPNPANQILYYEVKDMDNTKCATIKGYTLKDITGKPVLVKLDETLPQNGSIDISSYPAGLYFIYFKCADNTQVLYKFVIKH